MKKKKNKKNEVFTSYIRMVQACASWLQGVRVMLIPMLLQQVGPFANGYASGSSACRDHGMGNEVALCFVQV